MKSLLAGSVVLIMLAGLHECGNCQTPPVKYSLKRTKDYFFELTFTNAPKYIHSLKMKPESKEKELDQGDWLVLSVGAFSVPDIECINVAIDSAVKFGGKVQLGVRPFWDYEEVAKLLPEFKDRTGSPIWIYYRDGKLLWWQDSPLTARELEARLKMLTKGN